MSDAVKDIPVVILCGGKGMRIRQVSELLPKPLLPIGRQPILWHIMMIYASQGFRRFILCLGYKGDDIRDYFLNYHARTRDVTLEFGPDDGPPQVHYHDGARSSPAWSVTLADTGLDTHTGGRVGRIAKYLDSDLFMLTYGDGVADVDLAASVEQHRRLGGLVTVTGVHPPARFGHIEIEGDVIRDFAEKPQAHDGYISGGFMVVQRDFVSRYLSAAEACVLETDGLVRAAKDGKMSLYRHDGFWMPMDNHVEFNMLNGLWAQDAAPWKLW